MRSIFTTCLLGSTFLLSPAQALTITETNDATSLSSALFLDLPGGLTVTSSNITGFSAQSGTYTNETGTYGLPISGIVLSTGNVNNYGTGPVFGGGEVGGEFPEFEGSSGEGVVATQVTLSIDDQPLPEVDTNEPTPEMDVDNFGGVATPAQQARLVDITGAGSHFDVVELSIEFEAGEGIDQVTFFGAFGSNEFPDFVGSGFNDGFGLFVNGVNVAGVTPTGGGDNLPVNINHPDLVFAETLGLGTTGLNGVLAPNGVPVLRFDVPIVAGTNLFEIILADASDDVVDTTVYLSSFLATSSSGGGSPSVTNTGETELNPILPSNPPNPETGEFVVVIPEFDAGELIWIDPPVTTGYIYDAGTTAFQTLTAPSLATVQDTDGYIVTVGAQSHVIAAGETINFNTIFGINPTTFTLTDINPNLALDPANGAAFPVGVSFVTAGFGLNVSITPITTTVAAPIPLPAAGFLMGFGLLALGGVALRNRKARS